MQPPFKSFVSTEASSTLWPVCSSTKQITSQKIHLEYLDLCYHLLLAVAIESDVKEGCENSRKIPNSEFFHVNLKLISSI